MITCTKCNIEKSEGDFHNRKNRPKGKSSICKICASNRYKKYRENNLDLTSENAKLWKQNNPERMKELYKLNGRSKEKKLRTVLNSFKDKPCMDCGVKYPPYVMDFDHRDRSTKLFNVGQISKAGSIKRLVAEIEKCDLICSNCHRFRTFKKDDS